MLLKNVLIFLLRPDLAQHGPHWSLHLTIHLCWSQPLNPGYKQMYPSQSLFVCVAVWVLAKHLLGSNLSVCVWGGSWRPKIAADPLVWQSLIDERLCLGQRVMTESAACSLPCLFWQKMECLNVSAWRLLIKTQSVQIISSSQTSIQKKGWD